ncbi:MAG TPA: hypothetical protein PLG54_01930 [Bacteroidales bacterium]|jgi:hypothetical protein|nr:hypothetical protein [Bacteroidales bacterium]MDI9574434.1 hypothetical protein [Bacteroidota bacterium]MBP9511723.1 hypothetical protein [Bacteroidales bacterium]MBP9588731.1 hypothetical protein [Bacteroidales bacterium]NMD16610.1 hypothetical protein [Bacteroidales bacterium]
MTNEFKHYLRKLIILSVFLAILGTILKFVLPKGIITPAMPFILIFFMAHTLVYNNMAVNMIHQNPKKFVNFYMLSTVGRLILFVLLLVLYAFLVPKDFKAFTVCFFIFYLIYTFFELSTLLPQLRKKKP